MYSVDSKFEKGMIHHLRIFGAISYNEFPDNKFVEVLDSACENDTVVIHINTPGGSLDTTIYLCDLIERSDAQIVTVNSSQCSSAGTLLWMTGDVKLFTENSMFMFHTASFGSFGKGDNPGRDIRFIEEQVGRVAQKYMAPILNKRELKQVLRGNQDLYFSDLDMLERLGKKKMEGGYLSDFDDIIYGNYRGDTNER